MRARRLTHSARAGIDVSLKTMKPHIPEHDGTHLKECEYVSETSQQT